MSYFSEPIKFTGSLGEFPLDINCFQVSFESRHLLIDGKSWCRQTQKRWILARDYDHAREILDRYIKNEYYWPKGFHEVCSYPIVYLLKDPKQRNLFNHFWWDDSCHFKTPNNQELKEKAAN